MQEHNLAGSNRLVRDLVQPTLLEPVSWWPETLGWKLILMALLCLVGWKLFKVVKTYIANQYRRDAMSQLCQLSLTDPAKAIYKMNSLLKHTACHAYSHTQIATLADDQWLMFLRQSSQAQFKAGLAQRWQQALYNPMVLAKLSNDELIELKEQCEIWVSTHRGSER